MPIREIFAGFVVLCIAVLAGLFLTTFGLSVLTWDLVLCAVALVLFGLVLQEDDLGVAGIVVFFYGAFGCVVAWAVYFLSTHWHQLFR